MPNIKSAIKRVKTTATKHEANILKKGSMKTAVKKVEKEATVENLNTANKRIDKALKLSSMIFPNKQDQLYFMHQYIGKTK